MQYHISSGDVSIGASLPKTLLALFASASKRIKIRQVIIGVSGTPADNVCVFELTKLTADNGVGTTITSSIGKGDAATGTATATAKKNYSVEPTKQTDVIQFPVNQKSTLIWEPPADWDLLSNMSPGTVLGFAVVAETGPNLDANVTILFDEV